MKVEQYWYGMATATGKINEFWSSDTIRSTMYGKKEYFRKLKPEDSHQYLWFRNEQVIAYPVVQNVADKSNDGKRTWTQVQVFFVNIHEFLTAKISGAFDGYVLPEQTDFPDIGVLNV